MLKLMYFFLGYGLIKLLINASKYYKCKHYLNKYIEWLSNPDWELSEHKFHVIKLFKDAGLEDSTIQFVTPLGMSHVASGNAWVFAQFPSYSSEEIIAKTRGYFHEAIGVYRSRAREVFNPIYWIEFIIYLPKHIFNYLDVPPECVITKIGQLIYWLIVTSSSIFYALYTTEINALIREWLNKIIS